jgi:cell wall-associated NlpC family hydrolase
MTKFGICEQSLVPVRKYSSDQSEMINQLIFGDLLTILDTKGSWCLIVTQHDMYEGWVDVKQIAILTPSQFNKLISDTSYLLASTCVSASTKTGKTKHLILGSRLPNFNKNSFLISSEKYLFNGDIQTMPSKIIGSDIVSIAMKFIGTPYLWGGRSPFGIDCSGFTQIVFSMVGAKLKRDASLQVEMGEAIDFINESQAGDLAFFDNSEEKIIHVGIILNNKQIIHASGEVRIDSIDHQGIYNEEQKKYTHKLRIIKRITN